MAYDSKKNIKILENLNEEVKKNPNNYALWNLIYEVYMDIGCYEGALECCIEMLRLNPESKYLLQEQEHLKKRIAKVKNISEKRDTSGRITKPSTVSPKAPKKNKNKNIQEKPRKIEEVVEELKINIPKECSNQYTPNTKYQLRCDADKKRKFSKW